jgi:hypothetical protein
MELEMSTSKVRVCHDGRDEEQIAKSLILSFIGSRTSQHLDSNTVVERGVGVFIAAICWPEKV